MPELTETKMPKSINEALKILAYNDYFWSDPQKAHIKPHPKDQETVRSLAESQYVWTEKQARLALVILKRYLTKFQAHGMDIKSLLDKPMYEDEFRVISFDKSIEKFIDDDDQKKIEVRFPYNKKIINVFGGNQLRPNIHIMDMVRAYLVVLDAPKALIGGEVFNVGFKNQSVNELANDVKEVIGSDVKIIHTKSDDNRSYHVSSEKIRDVLNFNTKYTVKDAVSDLKNAFEKKSLINTFNDEFFFNIKRMQSINLK